MTKGENRAAAKACHREKQERLQQEIRAVNIAEDLKNLEALRRYLIFESRTNIPQEALQNAIDDYVEMLAGEPQHRWANHAEAEATGIAARGCQSLRERAA